MSEKVVVNRQQADMVPQVSTRLLPAMFLDDFRAALRHVRGVQKDTVVLLVVVCVLLIGARVMLALTQADPATGLSPEALGRLNVVDAGLFLIGLGLAVLAANWRWAGAFAHMIDVGVRADDEIERLKSDARGTRVGDLDAVLVARLVQDLDRSAQRAATAKAMASKELTLRVARVARDSRLLVDVVQPSLPGYSMLVDRFRLRHLVHQARDLANPPERLTVSVLIRADVPDTLKGDGPKLLRALAHVIGVASQHVDGDALFVTVSGRIHNDDVSLEIEVRGDRHVNSQPASDSLGLRAAEAMARGLGGRLEVFVSSEDGLRYTIYAPVAMHHEAQLDVHSEWDVVEDEAEAWALSQTQSIPRDLTLDESLEDAPTSEWAPVREATSSECELPVARAPRSFTRTIPGQVDDEETIPVTPTMEELALAEDLAVAEASREFAAERAKRTTVDLLTEWRVGGESEESADSEVTTLTNTDINYIQPDTFYGTPRMFQPEPMRPVRRTSGSTPVVDPTEGAGRLVVEPGQSGGADPLTVERRVLVVDHDAMARWSMTGQLSVYGYTVDAVATGRMALQALQRRAYAAVIIDTNMPGMDGLETAARIRSDEGNGPYVPLIAVIEEGSTDEHARCLAVGINELVHKPVDGEQLATMVDRLALTLLTDPSPVPRPATKEAVKTNVRSTASGLDIEVIECLERIQRVSDQTDLVNRMVDTFSGKATAAFDAFELGLDEGDPTLIRITSDRLRRSCAMLGVVGMERLCNLLADETRATGVERVREHIDGLDVEYRRVIPLLRSRASTRRPARI